MCLPSALWHQRHHSFKIFQSLQGFTKKEKKARVKGWISFICVSVPPTANHLLRLMSDGAGAAGKALQGPDIKQKLILTCTARGEAAAAGAIFDQTSHSSWGIRRWHVPRPGQHAKRAATHTQLHAKILLCLPLPLSQSDAISSAANQVQGSMQWGLCQSRSL